MSLHSLANHLQSAGRGEDKVLVHMTPGEVNGLQSLAMKHGGSLTINPETGLPEAGILKSLLPMLAGFALGPAGLGMSALNAGLTTAAIGTAATGSLGKGVMMGLGAYSGAGLGAGLQTMGTPAVEGVNQGINVADAGKMGFQNTGAKIGFRAPDAVSTTTGVDLANAGFKNPVLDAGFKNPVFDAGVVQNAQQVSVTPADASKFLDTNATNEAVLEKLKVKTLPTASGGPRPFTDLPEVAPSVIPPVDPRTLPGNPLYEPIRGQKISAFDFADDSVKGFPSPYHDASAGVRTINSTYSVPAEVNLMPANAVATQGLTGAPPAGAGPYDMASIRNVASRNGTVIADNLPPVESRTGLVPIEKVNLRPEVSTFRRLEVLPGDPPLANPRSITGPFRERMAVLGEGVKKSLSPEGLKALYAASEAAAPYGMYAGLGSTAYSMYEEKRQQMEDEARARAEASRGLIRPYAFDYGVGGGNVSAQPYYGSAERTYFRPSYTELPSYKAPGPEYAAKGGLMGLAVGGPVEDMAAMNSIGANTGYPMAALQTPVYSNPAMQRPEAMNVIAPSADAGVSSYSGELRFAAGGGISHLGDYSDGGRLLKGPGDGVSDSIPASIGNRQPARLADGEFVVPARIVSEIGNGSTEAGARKLYAMMDRVQKARRKTTGKNQVARNTKAERLLPA